MSVCIPSATASQLRTNGVDGLALGVKLLALGHVVGAALGLSLPPAPSVPAVPVPPDAKTEGRVTQKHGLAGRGKRAGGRRVEEKKGSCFSLCPSSASSPEGTAQHRHRLARRGDSTNGPGFRVMAMTRAGENRLRPGVVARRDPRFSSSDSARRPAIPLEHCARPGLCGLHLRGRVRLFRLRGRVW